MTARERTVIRAVIRALEDHDVNAIEYLFAAYGVQFHASQPLHLNCSGLLKALIDADS
jgi:hypothetical protein